MRAGVTGTGNGDGTGSGMGSMGCGERWRRRAGQMGGQRGVETPQETCKICKIYTQTKGKRKFGKRTVVFNTLRKD